VVVDPTADDPTVSAIPTQYDSPTQKFVLQSEDTAGFQARNSDDVMPNVSSTDSPIQPLLATIEIQWLGTLT
jgi:hypothetical protein